MNIVGIIPGRMASTRFAGKPLAEICGIPMIGHVYYRSRLSSLLNRVYIATCDKEVAKYAASIGCEAIMTSALHERASDRAKEAMLKIEKITGRKINIPVMIQGDEPMVYPEMIDEAIKPILNDNSINVVNLMAALKSKKEQDDLNVVKVVVDLNNDALYFSREPIPSGKKFKHEIISYKQIAIIPFRRDLLVKFNEFTPTPLEIIESVDMLRLLERGYKVRMVLTKFNTCGVDTPEDLKRVEKLMQKDKLFRVCGKEYSKVKA